MCGICGVLSPQLSRLDVEIFQQLMVVSTLRGVDGAGFAVVPKGSKEKVRIVRDPHVTAAELAYSGDFYQYYGDKMTCLLGHARYPTTGTRTTEDCHPHLTDHIVGVHNGTLDFVNDKAVKNKDNDSRMLFQAIANVGVEQAISHSIGSYAIVYIDTKTGTINFIRNDERSLSFAKIKGKDDTVYWASERDMLQMVLSRRTTKDVLHLSLPPDEHMTFRLNPLGPKIGYVDRKFIYSWKPDKKNETVIVPVEPPPFEGVRTKIEPGIGATFMTTKGHFHTRKDLEHILHNGCAYCECVHNWTDYMKGDVLFYQPTEFMCKTCLTGAEEMPRHIVASIDPPVTIPVDWLSMANLEKLKRANELRKSQNPDQPTSH